LEEGNRFLVQGEQEIGANKGGIFLNFWGQLKRLKPYFYSALLGLERIGDSGLGIGPKLI